MALEEGCPVKPFRVVLRFVPCLFYVSYLKTKNVPRVLRLFAGTRICATGDHFGVRRQIETPMRAYRHGTRRTRGTQITFNNLGVPRFLKTWNRHRTSFRQGTSERGRRARVLDVSEPWQVQGRLSMSAFNAFARPDFMCTALAWVGFVHRHAPNLSSGCSLVVFRLADGNRAMPFNLDATLTPVGNERCGFGPAIPDHSNRLRRLASEQISYVWYHT